MANYVDSTEAAVPADVLNVSRHVFGADLVKGKVPETFALWIKPQVTQAVAAASTNESVKKMVFKILSSIYLLVIHTS